MCYLGVLCFASVALIRLFADILSQLFTPLSLRTDPVTVSTRVLLEGTTEPRVATSSLLCADDPPKMLPPANKSNSQLLCCPLSGGDAAEVVSAASETGFKLGDVPCIFGEYKVEEAILLGDPIPESTECG